MASWVEVADDSDFSLQNLPYGVFSTTELDKRAGVAIGDHVLDMKLLAERGVFDALDFDTKTLQQSTLNEYAGLGRAVQRRVRDFLQDLLASESSKGSLLRDNIELRALALIPIKTVEMHLPMAIGDYTDFFVGPHHSKNCSDIFRPGAGLPASFFKMPLGYHGRASSVVVSGHPVQRPRGQFAGPDQQPYFGPSTKLDFEVEFAAFIGQGNAMGSFVPVDAAEQHLFGFVLLNDWSARDIQRMEATPLGPFNGKNFCTTISPWIVTPDALEPHRARPYGEHQVLPYLCEFRQDTVYNIAIDVHLQAPGHPPTHLTTCNTANVAFSFAQMLAHHTANGCPMRPGDLFATGTLSGTTRAELGCLLEITWDGREAWEAGEAGRGGCRRTYLEDGDEVVFKGWAGKGKGEEGRVGFGRCVGRVVEGGLSGEGGMGRGTGKRG